MIIHVGETLLLSAMRLQGLFGDELEKMRLRALVHSTPEGNAEPARAAPPPPFTVTPRKGQFAVFRPKADLPGPGPGPAAVDWLSPAMIVEPVPSSRTKGVILWRTVYGTVVVGPTATDQQSKEDRSTDAATMGELIAHARRVMPGLQHWEVIGSYAGLRPSTEHR